MTRRATAMLELLSGRWHEVLTAVVVRWRGFGGEHVLERLVTTAVEIETLDPDRIAAYVATGEPFDKAGAYAIQERGGELVGGSARQPQQRRRAPCRRDARACSTRCPAGGPTALWHDLAVVRDAPSESDREYNARRRLIDVSLGVVEDVIYVGISLLLVTAAAVLLWLSGDRLLDVFDDGSETPVVDTLDTLLLLFIVVELLSAVRVTITKRELLAEPFLLVGIIASIKEIVVLSVQAADTVGTGGKFRDQMWEIGVLGGVVLVLGVTAWMLRLKEREPDEASRALSTLDLRLPTTGRVA
ncbi:MAG: Maf family protein [Ilumatobacteraceae bacterium]